MLLLLLLARALACECSRVAGCYPTSVGRFLARQTLLHAAVEKVFVDSPLAFPVDRAVLTNGNVLLCFRQVRKVSLTHPLEVWSGCWGCCTPGRRKRLLNWVASHGVVYGEVVPGPEQQEGIAPDTLMVDVDAFTNELLEVYWKQQDVNSVPCWCIGCTPRMYLPHTCAPAACAAAACPQAALKLMYVEYDDDGNGVLSYPVRVACPPHHSFVVLAAHMVGLWLACNQEFTTIIGAAVPQQVPANKMIKMFSEVSVWLGCDVLQCAAK